MRVTEKMLRDCVARLNKLYPPKPTGEGEYSLYCAYGNTALYRRGAPHQYGQGYVDVYGLNSKKNIYLAMVNHWPELLTQE